MNKLYSQIASLIVVVALGFSFAFNLIDLATVVSASTAILGIIYGLYKQYETGVIESKMDSLALENLELKTTNKKFKSLNQILVETLKKQDISESVVQEAKPKKKYYKPKTK
jgi:hypothetical protein